MNKYSGEIFHDLFQDINEQIGNYKHWVIFKGHRGGLIAIIILICIIPSALITYSLTGTTPIISSLIFFGLAGLFMSLIGKFIRFCPFYILATTDSHFVVAEVPSSSVWTVKPLLTHLIRYEISKLDELSKTFHVDGNYVYFTAFKKPVKSSLFLKGNELVMHWRVIEKMISSD